MRLPHPLIHGVNQADISDHSNELYVYDNLSQSIFGVIEGEEGHNSVLVYNKLEQQKHSRPLS